MMASRWRSSLLILAPENQARPAQRDERTGSAYFFLPAACLAAIAWFFDFEATFAAFCF